VHDGVRRIVGPGACDLRVSFAARSGTPAAPTALPGSARLEGAVLIRLASVLARILGLDAFGRSCGAGLGTVIEAAGALAAAAAAASAPPACGSWRAFIAAVAVVGVFIGTACCARWRLLPLGPGRRRRSSGGDVRRLEDDQRRLEGRGCDRPDRRAGSDVALAARVAAA